jgi:hypothetical protein
MIFFEVVKLLFSLKVLTLRKRSDMRTKIVLMALIAVLSAGALNKANAHPGFRGGWCRPHIALSIGLPPICRPPVVVYDEPYYRGYYPRHRAYAYHGGYYGRGYCRPRGYGYGYGYHGCRRW